MLGIGFSWLTKEIINTGIAYIIFYIDIFIKSGDMDEVLNKYIKCISIIHYLKFNIWCAINSWADFSKQDLYIRVLDWRLGCNDKITNKKYHTVATFPKSDRKIAERTKINTPNFWFWNCYAYYLFCQA